jgi:hypothetical protein
MFLILALLAFLAAIADMGGLLIEHTKRLSAARRQSALPPARAIERKR